jgi:hypothetical protein
VDITIVGWKPDAIERRIEERQTEGWSMKQVDGRFIFYGRRDDRFGS